MILPAPEFPPLLQGHMFSEGEDLISEIMKGAEKGILSAGDLLWSTSTDRAECAIVLEPEVIANKALAMVPLAMVAVADSLGAIAPPNLAVTFGWPENIYANGAMVGRVNMKFPDYAKADQVPKFAILSLQINISESTDQTDQQLMEPGENLSSTVLYEEGCGDLDRTQIIESWSRHFLTWIDTWEQEGFKPVHENWLFRAKDRNEQVSLKVGETTHQGMLIGLDEDGGMLLKKEEGVALIPLSDFWFYDQKTGAGQ